jgi:hypothetical protein
MDRNTRQPSDQRFALGEARLEDIAQIFTVISALLGLC